MGQVVKNPCNQIGVPGSSELWLGQGNLRLSTKLLYGENSKVDLIDKGGSNVRRFRVRVDNEVFEVEVEEIGQKAGREPVVSVPQTSTPAPVLADTPVKRAEAKPASAAKPAAAQPASGGTGVVIAPIPGVITEIKVAAGNSVKKGDVLLILEAMKMQNEILAPYDATVTEICVSQGASVQTGDALVRLDK